MTRISLSLALLAGLTTAAMADPGAHHYSLLQSLIHLTTEPDHLAILAIVVASVALLLRKRKAT